MIGLLLLERRLPVLPDHDEGRQENRLERHDERQRRPRLGLDEQHPHREQRDVQIDELHRPRESGDLVGNSELGIFRTLVELVDHRGVVRHCQVESRRHERATFLLKTSEMVTSEANVDQAQRAPRRVAVHLVPRLNSWLAIRQCRWSSAEFELDVEREFENLGGAVASLVDAGRLVVDRLPPRHPSRAAAAVAPAGLSHLPLCGPRPLRRKRG